MKDSVVIAVVVNLTVALVASGQITLDDKERLEFEAKTANSSKTLIEGSVKPYYEAHNIISCDHNPDQFHASINPGVRLYKFDSSIRHNDFLAQSR